MFDFIRGDSDCHGDGGATVFRYSSYRPPDRAGSGLSICSSAEELAIRVLYKDYEQDEQEYGNLVDGLNDEWNRGVVFPLEGGAITAQLSDAQAKFNLNDLLNDRWRQDSYSD